MAEIEVGDKVVRKGRTVVGRVVQVRPGLLYPIAVEWPRRAVATPLAYYSETELEVVSV